MTARFSEGELWRLTVAKLRGELKKKGLGTNGRKQQLIARLLNSNHIMSKVNENTETSPVVRQRMSNNKTSNGQISQGLNKVLKVPKRKRTISEMEYHQMRSGEKKERDSLVLWWRPFITFQYFCLELAALFYLGFLRLWRQKKTAAVSFLAFLLLIYIYQIQGPHQAFIGVLRKNFLWWGYWVGLGVLSSVGLGTGLHTFLLYLGPHIATVTLAAYECMSVDFPEPPYPNEIICPDTKMANISIWTIISKVRLEAIMWGAGTAIGELPPYFMARAARMSGSDLEEDEFEEIEELILEKNKHPDDLRFLERAKLGVHSLVHRVGFFGILACASIPNPLFDLAGITCGHFLIPFWTFFGATLIGKAIIKMHIQKLFVIFMFSEHHVEQVVHFIKYIPKFGPSLQAPFKEWLHHQKAKLHHKPGTIETQDASWLAWVFEKVVMLMIAYFVLSIINSMAQSYHKRCCKEKHSHLKKVAKE